MAPDPSSAAGVDPTTRFRALYESTFKDIYAYAARALFPNQSEIDDVTAEIYLVAWRRLDALPDSPEDRLWLFGVARNVVANTRRSTNRRHQLADRMHRQTRLPLGSPDSSPVDVANALRRLSPKEREVMQLVVWDELTAAEAAKVLGCSVNVVEVRLHRARKRLARWLQAANDGPDVHPPTVVPTTEITTLRLDMEKPK
ncbi:MAG: RNA polymerase sigma factor [Acidimicrobiales bacterium]